MLLLYTLNISYGDSRPAHIVPFELGGVGFYGILLSGLLTSDQVVI